MAIHPFVTSLLVDVASCPKLARRSCQTNVIGRKTRRNKETDREDNDVRVEIVRQGLQPDAVTPVVLGTWTTFRTDLPAATGGRRRAPLPDP